MCAAKHEQRGDLRQIMLAVRVNLQGVAIALCHGMGEAGGDGGPLAMVARVAAQGNIGVARADFRDPRGLRRAGAIIDDNDRKPLGPQAPDNVAEHADMVKGGDDGARPEIGGAHALNVPEAAMSSP